MNVASLLAPVASATLGAATQQVAAVVQSGVSFASALHARASNAARTATSETDNFAAEQGPVQTKLSDQIQRDAMRRSLEPLRRSVQSMLRERFVQQGIDVSEPVVLVADRHGRVLEAGRHWDRARIEELLASDAELRHNVSLLLQQAASLYQAGGGDVESPPAPQLRLIVGQQEIFFQVV